jgi:hypothetical protein
VNVDECASQPCQAPGVCEDAVNAYICKCPDGYDAAGGTSCVDLDECKGSNVCAEDTLCRNSTPFYDCRGQFPDWPPAYDRNAFRASNGTVTDSRSGLVWQQNADQGDYDLASAKSYCASLSLAGAKWRVPTLAELESIVDDTKVEIAFDMSIFPNTPGTYFWTTTPHFGEKDSIWTVFRQGNPSPRTATSMGAVRCVREDG